MANFRVRDNRKSVLIAEQALQRQANVVRAEPLLSIREASTVLGNAGDSTIRAWCASGRLKSIKMVGRRLIPWSELQRFLTACGVETSGNNQ